MLSFNIGSAYIKSALGLVLVLSSSPQAGAACLSEVDLFAALPHTVAFEQGTVRPPDFMRVAPGFAGQAVAGWPAGVGLMAFTRRADGAVMLVPDRGFRLGGQYYRRGQMLELVNGQLSAVNWLGENRLVRAIDHYDNRYFFVQEGYTDSEGIIQIGPRDVLTNVLDEDGNPIGAIAVFEVGKPGDLPRNVRIDGLAVIDSDYWLLTFDRGFALNGEYYARSDVVLYRVQSQTFERALALNDVDSRWETLAPIDISLRQRIDQIFRDRFQSGAGLAGIPEGVGPCS